MVPLAFVLLTRQPFVPRHLVREAHLEVAFLA